MKTLKELCVPRQNVFDQSKSEDELDLTDLLEGNVEPAKFFEENYITEGMDLLFKTAFERFHKKSARGLIKLTQSMGGGKTHNMIALGLLAQYPEYRKKLMGDNYADENLGEVRVVSFTGRQSVNYP
jgi:predicted AAA+ superfamily ATPase